jgi:hypothetical protein
MAANACHGLSMNKGSASQDRTRLNHEFAVSLTFEAGLAEMEEGL